MNTQTCRETPWNILARKEGPARNSNLGRGPGGVKAAGSNDIHPPINPRNTKGPFIYEDELPEDISQEDYDSWYERSFVDFVRIGPRGIPQ